MNEAEAEAKREEALRRLATLQRVFLAFAIAYLALHTLVSLSATMDKGAVAGLATLLTLGFGDAYWAFAWSGQPGFAAERFAAVFAAVMAFLSWGTRRWTTRYIYRVAADGFTVADEQEPAALDQDDALHAPRGAGVDPATPKGGAA